MNFNSSELDQTGPPPEQEQLTDIVNLVDALTEKDAFTASEVWKDKGYHVQDGDIDAISISRLTKEGEREHPNYPLVIVRVFRKKDEGRVGTDYRISKDKGKLRIDRYESVQTAEGDQDHMEMKKRIATASLTQTNDILQEIEDRVERRRQGYDFKRKIGYTYTDRTETQQVIDCLRRLREEQS